MLFIVIEAVLFVGCALCVWASYRHTADGAEIAHDIRTSRGRIIANESAIEALENKFRVLQGRFYAKARIWDEALEQLDGSELEPELVERSQNVTPIPDFCANYGQAQIEGPKSEAARCECGYCVEMRARRARARAELIPKTAAGQAKMAEDNANA